MHEEEDDERIAQARLQMWQEGDLTYLLDENQLEMYAAIKDSKQKYFVVESARRLGKSYLLCILAIEQCIQKPNSRVLYAAPTTKDAIEIVAPLIEEICKDAPFPVRFDRQQSKFVFPGKAQLRLFGCDNKTKANRGRGAGAHLVLLDEAGFIPTLDYVLHSIVAPQTLTTKGRVVLASTPSDEPDHPFTALAEKAEARGYYLRKSIYDNPRLTASEIQQYIEDDAAILGMSVDEFKQSDVYKREHLAIRAIDTNLVVVPEWRGQFETVERPEFYDGYVSLDLGGVDPHGLLFGYWDYANQTLVIEDELLLRDGENTEEIVDRVKQKEAHLWGSTAWTGTLRAAQERAGVVFGLDQRHQPYLRVADSGGPKLELRVNGVSFLPTEKGEKWVHVNSVRVMLREGKIKISPVCKNLGRQLKQTMWQSVKTTTYRRKGGEHGDLVDCLVYMARSIRRTRDPRPVLFGVNTENAWLRKEPRSKASWLGWSDETPIK